MTLTINLTQEQEVQLKEAAKRSRLPVEKYVIQKLLLVDGQADIPGANNLTQYEEMQKFLREAGADQSSYAITPNALSRESLYAEREDKQV